MKWLMFYISRKPAGFWLTSPLTRMRNNVAAGGAVSTPITCNKKLKHYHLRVNVQIGPPSMFAIRYMGTQYSNREIPGQYARYCMIYNVKVPQSMAIGDETQNKAQWLAACGRMSASSQSLCFILSLRLNSSFITSMPVGDHNYCSYTMNCKEYVLLYNKCGGSWTAVGFDVTVQLL